MQPEKRAFNVPADLTAFVRERRVHIRADIDRKFRKALREAVAQDGNTIARFHIGNALANGPSRGGFAEAKAFFGTAFEPKLALTAMIVDGLEITVPGFKKWLELTGFGNDKTMIRGFVAWAEYRAGQGKVLSGVKQAFDSE